MLSESLQRLVEQAQDEARRGLGPDHTVGAALLTEGGRVVRGLNTHHYLGGPCAETVALSNHAARCPEDPVRAVVAVHGPTRGVIAPCGMCRQILFEIDPGIECGVPGPEGPEMHPVRALLPRPYDRAELARAEGDSLRDRSRTHERQPAEETLTAGGRLYRVRRARPEDVAGLVALLADDVLGRDRESAAAEAYREAFEEIDADPRHLLAVVVAQDGALAGTMQLTILPGLSRGGARRLQIEAVRIAAGERGQGLGSAMISWAEEYGLRRGAVLAQLTSDNVRADAHRFYERLGYAASHTGFKKPLG
jgi:cytidine deaminase/GNAT superfamily N-acetyltransferase